MIYFEMNSINGESHGSYFFFKSPNPFLFVLLYLFTTTAASWQLRLCFCLTSCVASMWFGSLVDRDHARETSMHALNPSLRYKWGNYQDYLFERNLSLAYEKIVYWKKNLFLLPSGQEGKSFIDEISRLMNEWIHESPLKDIAFKAIMVMPGLLLQKPSRKSKSKDHLTSLENRMKPWHAGEIMELLKETDTIQKDLRVSNTLSTITKISKIFLDNTKLKTVWIKITTFFK